MKAAWYKKGIARTRISDKLTWNGLDKFFLAFCQGIKGHLLQVGAGYILDDQFLALYAADPKKYQHPLSYNNLDHVSVLSGASCIQIHYDKAFLFGALVSACRNISHKTILAHTKDRDGILAWQELSEDFDNDISPDY